MTRGDLINERARAGMAVAKLRASGAPKKEVDEALAYYGQCLWEEEHWQATIAAHARLGDGAMRF